ncbi:putative reverse transcriptase domain-containing protein [Tanacetum coccineum]
MQGVSLRITSGVRFRRRPTAKGVRLRVADSYTGNHLEDGFTPLETIQRLLVVIGRRSHSGFEREAFDLERRQAEHEEHLKLILELLTEVVLGREEFMPILFKCLCRVYYEDSFEGFSKITRSLTKLTQTKVKFNWGDKEEATFQLLKEKLCSAPILALPDGAENFVIYYDASHKGLGVVLMKNEKVIAYASRQLKTQEKN